MAKVEDINAHPPRLALRLLNLTLPLSVREHLIGDLLENYQDKHALSGAFEAKRWFWWQTVQAVYEFLNKQQRGILMFIISIAVLVLITVVPMQLGMDVFGYVDVPSLMFVPAAMVFGVAATSTQTMKLALKLCISEQAQPAPQQIVAAGRFFQVTGTSGMWLGFLYALIGWVAMASNIEPEVFSSVFGPAFSVSILSLLYAVILKVLCYVAEQRILGLADKLLAE